MYGCESWTIKKLHHQCQRTDIFKLWDSRRLLIVPWTARSNQSILKEINPEYSLEGLMLKLNLQSFGHLMWRADSLKKTLMQKDPDAGKDGGQEEKVTTEDEMVGWHRRINGHVFGWIWELLMDGRPGMLQFMELQSRTWLSDWTDT